MKRTVLYGLLLLSGAAFAELPRQALWFNADQRAHRLLEQQKPIQAAAQFHDAEWRGSAHFRAGNYAEAVRSFSAVRNARANYNRANALVHLGEYERALRLYERILADDPAFEDAAHNRDIARQLLEQQVPESSATESPARGSQSESPPQAETAPQQKPSPDKPSDKSEPERTATDEEIERAAAQWLRQIDDDPGALLKRKIRQTHLRHYPQVTDAIEPW